MALLIASLAAGAALQATPAPPPAGARNVCDLLAAEEIRTVQNAALTERKTTEHTRSGLRFAQCVFATSDFVRSVSLSVITGNGERGARGYWEDTFHTKHKEADSKNAPRPVSGVGDEAFWTGDARAGALYVLSGDVVLRVSVGGVTDEEERIRRSKALLQAALRRLQTTR
jgi:hypothetical protein